jgi:hypothetical protein
MNRIDSYDIRVRTLSRMRPIGKLMASAVKRFELVLCAT